MYPSKSFDRVDYRYLASVLQAARFEPESASGSATCIAPPLLWYRYWESSRTRLCCHGRFDRVICCRPYFTLWRLSVKGRGEDFTVYVFHLIFYRWALLPLCKNRKETPDPLFFTLLWGGREHLVRRETIA